MNEVRSGKFSFKTVYSTNSTYGFHLNQRLPADGMALQTLFDDPVRGKQQVMNHYATEIHCAINFNGRKSPVYLDNNILRIDSVTELTEASESKRLLIRLGIIDDPKFKKQANNIDVDGWVIVSPDEGWIIREYGSVNTTGKKVQWTNIGKIEYARSSDGHLDPTKLTQRTYRGRADRNHPGEAGAGFDLDFEAVKYEALPEAQFRLPAFGLPEVDPDIKKGAVDRPYGIFAPAGVGFGLAGGLKYLASRRNRP